MKSLLLSTALVGVCLSNAEAQKRMTLHEEFTGENCPACASTNPGFWALCDLAANQSKIIHLSYMAPIAGAGPFYNTSAPLTTLDARRMYYTIPFGPYGRYDGAVPSPSCGTPPGASAGHPGCFTQAEIDNEANVPSIFYITATHYFNSAKDSVFGKIVITPSAAASTAQHKLRIAFAKSMHFTTAPGSNGEKDFSNVVRAMFPDADGITLPTTMAAGVPVTFTYKGKIGGLEVLSNYTTADSMFAVWIQNDATKAIRQAARSTYAPVGVDNVASLLNSFSIFPNPASNYVNVQGALANPGEMKITITNSVGQVVQEKEFAVRQAAFNENIPLANISSGNYFMTVVAGGEKVTKAFTVNK